MKLRFVKIVNGYRIVIPKPVWAVGFALEQTLHVVALAVFSYVDFKVASAYFMLFFDLREVVLY
ncbi:MAG: hypothetical protein LBH59_09275 [Planctomycetaceae bacterium]|nr:hypothetical protein [Planctomycetaceae bacterium]